MRADEALSTDKPAAVTFDTLVAAQNLRTSGLEERQAEAIVATISKAMSETVATKADLELQGAATRADIHAQRSDVKAEIEALRSEFKADMNLFKLSVETRFKALEESMASMQDKIVIKIGALMVTMTFLLLAIGPFYFRWVISLTASQ